LLKYLRIFINSINLEPYLTGMAQPKMNQAQTNSIPVALPPLAEQHRIVAKVEELLAWCDELEARLTAAQTTAAALLDSTLRQILAAFAGQLVPQDPADEPADELLARLKPGKK